MDEADNNIRLLAGLAQRLQEKPDYMAYALAMYKKTENLDDLALCEKLGTLPEMVVRLALCKRPRKVSPDFADQVRELSDFTLIEEAALERIIEYSDSLSESARYPRRTGIRLPHDWRSGLLAQVSRRSLAIAKAHGLTFASVISALLLIAGYCLLREPAKSPPSLVGNNAGQFAESSGRPDEAKTNSVPLRKHEPLPNKRAARDRRLQVNGLIPQESIAQVSINLEEYARLREADVEERPINVPQSRVRLLVNMPEGSPRGSYTVSLVDAFGNSLISKKAANRDGKILRVILDTSGLQEKKYIFCISREGEIPDCYTLTVSSIHRPIRPDRNP